MTRQRDFEKRRAKKIAMLEKVTQKALDAGFLSEYADDIEFEFSSNLSGVFFDEFSFGEHYVFKFPFESAKDPKKAGKVYRSLSQLLFDHDFAKAFWGERRDITHYKFFLDGLYHDNVSVEEYDETQQDEHEREWERYEPVYRHQGWQYHLQQAVLSEDPLLYYFERL